jgi:hypothetical protein
MARYRPGRYRSRGRGTPAEKAIGVGVVAAVVAFGHHAIPHAGAHASTAAPSAATAGAQMSTASANVALGKALASSRGWGAGAQWACLDELWTRESGWRMVWNYGGSGAYGIPQSLPAGKMAAAGADYMTDPATQIRWGLGYIASTYGTPCDAWAHETSAGWY